MLPDEGSFEEEALGRGEGSLMALGFVLVLLVGVVSLGSVFFFGGFMVEPELLSGEERPAADAGRPLEAVGAEHASERPEEAAPVREEITETPPPVEPVVSDNPSPAPELVELEVTTPPAAAAPPTASVPPERPPAAVTDPGAVDELTSTETTAPVDVTVKLLSVPRTASLMIDGENAGRTPAKLQLAPGAHVVRIVSGDAERAFAVEVVEGADNKWCYVFSSSEVRSGACD